MEEIKTGFYEDKDGDLAYISENGIRYALYEGVTISDGNGVRTSDIVFVMVDEIDFDDQLPDRLVGWMAGATRLNDGNEERRAEWRGYVADIVRDFEKKHEQWVISTFDAKTRIQDGKNA